MDINLGTILDQAGEWTFAGDYQLFQWMNKISQSLETRASSTIEKLDRLNNNIKYTHTALDNVTNSLTALQYGNQFVECRVEDDDETTSPAGNVLCSTNGDNLEKPTAKEAFTAFLDNNLKLLRIYEKYTLDVYDSDDDDDIDEGKREKACIFQPINPYNERPLPHIFGSKDWHTTSHVGLQYEQRENTYSGDEASDAFSESSASAAADNDDSYETNSECASSFTASNNTFGGNFEIRNATSTLLPSNSKISNAQSISESSSAHSNNARITNFHTPINSIKRSESSSSTNSKTPSFQEPILPRVTAIPSSRPFQSNIPPYTDLFSEPPEDVQSTPSSSFSRKTVNLFNDDDDVYKHLVIAGSKGNEPIAKIEQTTGNIEEKPTAEQQIAFKPKINEISKPIFVEELQDKLMHKTDTPRRTSSVVKKDNKVSSVSLPKTRTNLFDDEDDDDFLSAFVNKQKIPSSSAVPSSSLLKENFVRPIPATNTMAVSKDVHVNKNRQINLFEDSNEDDDDFANLKGENKITAQTPKDINAKQENISKPSILSSLKTTNLFDDDDDEEEDDLFKTKSKIFSAGLNKSQEEGKHLQQNQKEEEGTEERADNFIKKDNKLEKVSSSFGEMEEEEDFFDKMFPLPKKANVLFTNTEEIPSKPSNDSQKDVDNTPKSSVGDQIQPITTKYNLFDNVGTLGEQNKFPGSNKPAKEDVKIVPSPLPRMASNASNDKPDILNAEGKDSNVENKNLFDDAATLGAPTQNQSVNLPTAKKVILEVTPSPLPRKSSNIFEIIPSLNDEIENRNILKTPCDIKGSTNHIEQANISNDTKETQENTNIHRNILFEDDSQNNQEIDKNVPIATDQDMNSSFIENHTKMSDKEESLFSESLEAKPLAVVENEQSTKAIDNVSMVPANIDISISDVSTKNNPENKNNELQLGQKTNEFESADKDSPAIAMPSANKIYNFDSSLLFDEPPDDNDFFESLGKSTQNPSMKFSGFDLDHDLYSEPELPKTSLSSSAATGEKVSEYKALQLFSDIPPEDNDFEAVSNTNVIEGSTKPLSNVFYDDFDETIEAIDRNKNKSSTYVHPVFNDEPPSVDKQSTTESERIDKQESSFDTKENSVNMEKNVADLNPSPLSIKHKIDEVGHITENKVEVENRNTENEANKKSFNNRPISKLQMPKFNINVQALLPGSVGKPSSLKVVPKEGEEIEKSLPLPEQIESVNKDNVVPTEQQDHILPNVNKNRVRAPLNRRPSTRKARQENIRKSLLEEQLLNNQNEAIHKIQSDDDIRPGKIPSKKLPDVVLPITRDSLKSSNENLRSTGLIKNVETFKSSKENEDIAKTVQKSPLNTFLDDDDDEEDEKDLFKSVIHRKMVNKTDGKTASNSNATSNTIGNEKDLRSSTSVTTIDSNKKSEIISDSNKHVGSPMDITKEIRPPLTLTTPDSIVKSENIVTSGTLLNPYVKQNPLTTPTAPNTSSADADKVSSSTSKTREEVKPNSKSLFTDSDSESENDFFAKLGSTKATNLASSKTQNTDTNSKNISSIQKIETKKHSSIFSDDSEDENDDFLKPTTKLQITKTKPKATTHSGSIFSDIESDDDNDLFKTTTKATKNPSATITAHGTATNAATKIKESIEATPIADNPLADLL
ncbi:family with sequence similarity 21 isoform X2 [Musca autumnalis]|uniref:family with sequence similarity 21 isoform X2 n=1 Tax=Musca autumnalis TaxID=221902 RepID=UPI003CEF4AAB